MLGPKVRRLTKLQRELTEKKAWVAQASSWHFTPETVGIVERTIPHVQREYDALHKEISDVLAPLGMHLQVYANSDGWCAEFDEE